MKLFLCIALFLVSLDQALALQAGDKPPACSARFMADNKLLDLTTFTGKVVLVDFWASWCPPCKKSVPFLNHLQQVFAAKGLEIIAINVDEDVDDARQFLNQYPIHYTVALDPSGDCARRFDVKAMPSSYFIDKNGVIQLVHLGFKEREKEDIEQIVRILLDEKTE